MSAKRARRLTLGVSVSVATLAVTTGAIYGLREIAPVLSLGALYVLAVLVVAIGWGAVYGVLVSVASMLAFNFLFPAPDAHAQAARVGELVRARYLPRHRGRRQPAGAPPNGRGGAAPP